MKFHSEEKIHEVLLRFHCKKNGYMKFYSVTNRYVNFHPENKGCMKFHAYFYLVHHILYFFIQVLSCICNLDICLK